MSTIIQNPLVPFTTSFPSGRLQAGTVLLIYGEPTPGAQRFAVDLVSLRHNSTCVFHFNPRFNEGNTVCNSNYPSGHWATEQKWHLPFFVGRPFALQLRCLADRYLVAVDGNHFCEFYHRASFSEVDALQIQGSVRLAQVVIQAAQSHPVRPPTFPAYRPPTKLQVTSPRLPFVGRITGQLSVGGELQVYGQVKPSANRFHVNLQKGVTASPHPTIALHFNPRYREPNVPPSETLIVTNSWINAWGTEQRTRCSALRPGNNFVLIIRRQQYHYDISVDGNLVANYPHRITGDIVDSVAIDGDVIINSVSVL